MREKALEEDHHGQGVRDILWLAKGAKDTGLVFNPGNPVKKTRVGIALRVLSLVFPCPAGNQGRENFQANGGARTKRMGVESGQRVPGLAAEANC
jgi:hypothetical protein